MELDLPYFFDTKLKKFSRAMEGGPGKPLTLLIHFVIIIFLFIFGKIKMDTAGISSGGPAIILLSVFWAATLIFWIIIKAGIRDTKVHINIDATGIEMLITAKQKNTDRKLQMMMLLVFLFTFKGGQWSSWESSVKWKKVKKVIFYDQKQEILIKGGPWDIRIPCDENNYQSLSDFILERVKKKPVKRVS